MRARIALVVLLAVAMAMAQDVKPTKAPGVPDGEARKLRVRYEDPKYTDAYFASKPTNQRVLHDQAASSIETMARYKGDGKNRQLVYTRSEVLHNRNNSTWKMTFSAGDNFQLVTMEREVKNSAGKVVEQGFWDMSDPSLHFPADTYHPYTIEVYFRSLPLQVGYKGSFHLWLATKSVTRMWVTVEKIETIKTPVGDVECYCLQMVPNLEDFVGKTAGKMIQSLVPKFTFWLAVKGSHPLVKYRGPLGEVNFGNPPIEVHELTSILPGL